MQTWKKNILLLVLIALTGSLCQAQNWWKNGISGEGPKVTKTLDLSKFQGFSLAIGGKVYVRQGNTQTVKVEGQQNIIDNLKTEVNNGVWKIGFDQPVRNHEGLTIWITVPTLTEANISGSGNIVGEGPFRNLGDFSTGISGSGDINLEVEAKNVSASISGSGDLQLSGKADMVKCRISGSGDIDTGKLKVQSSEVSISGSGDCTVFAEEDLAVSTSGSGDVYYLGRPRVKARVSGSGKVEPRN